MDSAICGTLMTISACRKGVVVKDAFSGSDIVVFHVQVGLMGRSTEGAEAEAMRSKLQDRPERQAIGKREEVQHDGPDVAGKVRFCVKLKIGFAKAFAVQL